MKKFFKKTEGFTLVELIVVIAILGILAGVGTVGYSGYIKKAQTAADNQIVSAINTAFAAACIQNGVNNTDITGVTQDWDDAGKVFEDITAVTSTKITLSADKAAKIVDTFGDFYKSEGEFKTTSTLNFANGVFSLPGANTVSVKYGGIELWVSQEYVDALNNSTYKAMGVNALLGQLDTVTGLAAGMTDGALGSILTSAGFVTSSLESMGLNPADYSSEAEKLAVLQQQNETLAREMLKNKGITAPTATQLSGAMNQVAANAAVLYTAQQTAGMSKEAATNLLTTATKSDIKNKMLAGNAEGLTQAALVCGMYTAYVNSDAYKGTDKTVDAGKVLNALANDSEFTAFFTSEQGQKDLAGYMGSLGMVNSTLGNTNATEKLMVNGFADPDLAAALNGLIG